MTPQALADWTLRIPVLNSDTRPIWSQVEEGIRRLIASGELNEDDPVPSVRELSTSLRINPGTVSQAYQHLVGSGLLVVRRGEGTFVAGSVASLRKSEQTRLVREAALRFASFAITHGADQAAARDAVESAMRELSSKAK